MGAVAIRPDGPDDRPFLESMLLAAAFWRDRPGDLPPVEAVRARPELAVYVRDWGRPGDRGVVAWEGTQRRGAAWYRLFDDDAPGYGYVDPHTPEVTVGVAHGQRRRGLGRALLATLLAQAAVDGHRRLSLSVEVDNPARHLYARLGFGTVERVDGAVTMVAVLPVDTSGPQAPGPSAVTRSTTAAMPDS